MCTRTTPQSPSGTADGDETTVTLTAKAVRDAEDVIAPQLAEIPSAKDQHLQLDFADVDYLNVVELGTLIALHKRVRRAGGRLTLCNLAAHLRELFTVTCLDTVLTVCQEGNGDPLK
jgi:anti-anti-sigma factor